MNFERFNPRLLITLAVVIFSVISYYFKSEINPVTGEKQRVSITPEQEVSMGLQSAPQMISEYGGLYPEESIQKKVNVIGQKIVASTQVKNSPYQFNFYVLADDRTINAFALPGGQIFITYALLKRFTNDSQLASVLGHEIGHVINRHSAEQMAKDGLLKGIVSGVAMGSDMSSAQVAQYVGQMMNMKYGREDELEADKYGILYSHQSGYDASQAIKVMQILAEASGGSKRDEFSSTHPSPENRIVKIKEELSKLK